MCTTISLTILVYDILIYYLSVALSGETGSSEISSLILDLDSLVGLNVEWNSSIILSSLYISLVFIVFIINWLHIYYPV